MPDNQWRGGEAESPCDEPSVTDVGPEIGIGHEPICSKVSNKKKKVFNSYKQRVAGTDVSSVRGPSAAKMPQPVSHWKQQHEDFINTIRSARLATDAVKKGLPLPPPPPASINPDYIECPYCNRRFNETAAERHISFCKTNVNRKVVARHDPTPSSFHPRAPPPPAQVQLASKQPTSPVRTPAVPSTSYQAPRGPPVQPVPPIRTAQAVHSRPTTLSSPSAAGSPSRGKLSSAAQAVMGVRAGKGYLDEGFCSCGVVKVGNTMETEMACLVTE
ncbi:hypothetical protein chiPu_0015322 [Chiloscyllium punctatum]|uniref:C2HC/C3H-type domain-containing protein n=1 Tax=Chiloscyllium punctatum TaxID=137246 RepID=A0A401T2F0_CHIPU|nr:hypothetical protein [Chiloscyllium punctatum]